MTLFKLNPLTERELLQVAVFIFKPSAHVALNDYNYNYNSVMELFPELR